MKTAIEQWEQGHCEIGLYCSIYYDWIKFFQHFGKSIAFAFKDTIEKADTIKSNAVVMADKEKLIESGSDETKYIQDYCQFEKTQNC